MSSKGTQPPGVNSAVGASSTTAGLPAPPLQPPSAQSAYTPMPKPGADYGQTQSYEQQQANQAAAQAPPTPQASPTPEGPANPNPSALAPQGANVAGDVWAPGTGPQGGYNTYGGANGYGGVGGKASKGGMPPSMGGGSPGAPGGGMAPGMPGVSGQQPGGAGAFGGQFEAIKNKLGSDAAQTFAVKNWGSGGQQALQQMYGGDTDAYNAAINAHGAGGTQTGISGRTVVGPDGQRYQVGEQGTVKGAGSNKANRRLYQDQAWLNQNAVKL